MNLLEIILGQIPEAIYFALFLIYTKRLKGRRNVLFTFLMVVEYILILYVLPFSIWVHILYFAMAYIILKLLYKERSQITDVFILGLASLLLMLISGLCYFIISLTIKNIIVCTILAKTLMFVFLFITKDKLPNIQKLYKRLWNRNDKIPKYMKSTTFRCINLIVFNIMFYLINFYIIFYLVRRC